MALTPAPQKAPMVYGPDDTLVPLGPEGTITGLDTPGTGGVFGSVPSRSGGQPRVRRSEDEVAALNQQLANDPELQRLVGMDPNDQTTRDLWTRYVQRTGLTVPEGYQWNPETRQLDRMSFYERHPFLTSAALGVGGVVGGGLAAGALAGGGAGAGAGGTLAATPPALTAGTLAPSVSSAGIGAGVGAGASGATAGAGAGAGTLAATTPALSTGTLAPSVTPALGAGGSMGIGSSILGALQNPETYATIAGQIGRLSEGQAGERGNENRYGMDLNRALASLFATEQGASSHAADAEERGALDRARFGLQAPDIRTSQSVRGSLLQNLQPVTFGNTGRVKVPTISGGLTPAALNPAARETGSILQKQAIDALLSGSDIPEETDFQTARLTPPELTPYQEPGRGESILSGVGAGGNIMQGILETLRRQSETPSAGARG